MNSGLFGHQKWIGRLGNIGFKQMDKPEKHLFLKNNEQFRIPRDEIRQVYEGFEVTSHSYRHEMLARLSAEEMEKSISLDIKLLSELAGYPIVGHAYPSGSSSDVVAKCLQKQGVRYAREAFGNGCFKFPANPLRYPPTCWAIQRKAPDLLDQFLKAQAETEDLLFSIWGHGYEMDFGTRQSSWEKLEKMFAKVSGHVNIIYCTNKEAFERIGQIRGEDLSNESLGKHLGTESHKYFL